MSFRHAFECAGIPDELGAQVALDVAKEFKHRPWQKNVECLWLGGRIVLTAESDSDATGEALGDEFSDAVAASVSTGYSISKVSVDSFSPPNKSLERTRGG